MCASYTPTQTGRIAEHFGAIIKKPYRPYQPLSFPGSMVPIIRASTGQTTSTECVAACFGMVPHWAEMKLAKQTYNARSETVATKPSFQNAWRRRQFCIIPADAIFEPCYESGKAVRWQIAHASERPLAIAGIWETRAQEPDGVPLVSFSMLTINADVHGVMQRMHKPGEEKRMVVLLEPEQCDAWLTMRSLDVTRFLQPYPEAQLVAAPAPVSPIEFNPQLSLFAL